MMIIAFSKKTSRIIPKIFCRHFRHVAPILIMDNDLKQTMVLWQFTKRNQITYIQINVRDIQILKQYSWVFVLVKDKINTPNTNICDARTCVDLCKRMMNIHNWMLQTPDGLYKYLKQHYKNTIL